MRDRLEELLGAPECALDLAPYEAAHLLAKVEGVAAALRARLAMPVPSVEQGPKQNGDGPGRLLTPEAAADLAGVSRRQIYSWSRRSDWAPFVRRLSRKTLRVEEGGLRRWLER